MTASPLATGGAGPDFESEVAVHYLAALLAGGAARGSANGRVTRVGLQRAASGAPLDDVVIDTAGTAGRARLDLQVKRRLTFTRSDRELPEVLGACWETLRLTGSASPDMRFGVAIAQFPERVKGHYARVPIWAQSSADAADFFHRMAIPRFASNEMREFVAIVRDLLAAYVGRRKDEAVKAGTEIEILEVTDEALWQLFRRLVIIDFDYTQDASRDRVNTIEVVRQLLPDGDPTHARALYDRLSAITRETAQTGGSHTEVTLRQRLLADGAIDLRPTPDCQNDLDRISEHTELVLGAINSTIGGVVLDRSEVVTDVLTRIDAGGTVILTGAPGVGKSAILKSVGEARSSDGCVIALAGQRLASVAGWNGFAAMLQLEHRLAELVSSLSGTARPCLLIDGIDKLEDPGGRQAVNDILMALSSAPVAGKGVTRWSVVITTRAETLDMVREWLQLPVLLGRTANPRGQVIHIPDLSDEDLTAVATRLPHLRRVLATPHVATVLRNPYNLSVIDQSLELAEGDSSEVQPQELLVTEADVLDIWWQRVVGRNAGRDRQETMLRLGERSLIDHSHSLTGQELDARVLRGLEFDGVLRRDTTSDKYWFGHDILEEWTAVRVLNQQSEPIAYLHSLGDPYWAVGALQLLACSRLEEQDGYPAWRVLLDSAEGHGRTPAVAREDRKPEGGTFSESPSDSLTSAHARWVDAVLTGPFRSARLSDLLPIIGDTLLEEDGARLATILRALRTRFVKPNPLLEAFLETQQVTAEERDALLLDMGVPWGQAWVSVLEWLAPRLTGLPGRARDEASRVMLVWQRLSILGLPFRKEIAEAAVAWRSVLVQPSGARVYVSRGAEPFFARLRDIIALSADVIPERIAGFLEQLRLTDSEHDVQMWVGRSAQLGLARHAAAAYVDFVLDVLVPAWRITAQANAGKKGRRQAAAMLRPDSEDEEWQHLHLHLSSAFLSPSHLKGPFLMLLRANEREGLRLVLTLVNRATASFIRNQDLYGAEPQPSILLHLPKIPSNPPVAGTTDAGELAGPTAPVIPGTEGSDERRFAGGIQVYQWFRPNGNAPYPVVSALMALEVWMEDQIEQGREPVSLFNAVVANSDSAAIVGACMGIALAYPAQCLRAAAPLVGALLVWEYDIARHVSDQHGTYRLPAEWGINDPAGQFALKRDERPQRRSEVRDLMWRYLFSADEPLRAQVVAAVSEFPNDLSLLTDEQKADPASVEAFRRHVENYVVWADPKNYRWAKTDDGQAAIVFEPPVALMERNAEARRRYEKTSTYLALHVWADKTLDEGRTDARMTIAEAVAQAQALQRPGDFEVAFSLSGDTMDGMRLEAVVATAAAVLRVDPAWVQSAGHLQWCSKTLIAAASTPRVSGDALGDLAGVSVLVAAAQGLMAIAGLGWADERGRIAILGLARHPERRVVEAVFARAREVWDADPVLCKNLVARELAAATAPRHTWALDLGERERLEEQRLAWWRDLEAVSEASIRGERLPPAIGLGRATGGTLMRASQRLQMTAGCLASSGRIALFAFYRACLSVACQTGQSGSGCWR